MGLIGQSTSLSSGPQASLRQDVEMLGVLLEELLLPGDARYSDKARPRRSGVAHVLDAAKGAPGAPAYLGAKPLLDDLRALEAASAAAARSRRSRATPSRA